MLTSELNFTAIALLAQADPNKDTGPWRLAISQGNKAFVGLLIHAPISISRTHIPGSLTETVRSRHISTLQLLLDAGADKNHENAEAFELAMNTE